MESKVVYFDRPGPENLEETLRIARERAEQLGIKTIIVATTVGTTAVRAIEVFRDMKVVAVTHSAGFRGPNTQELTPENRARFEKGGGIVLTATHLFSGVGGAMRKKFNQYLLGDIIANTLRIMGQGMKVVVEISDDAIVRETRKDTGEIINVRPARDEERQLSLLTKDAELEKLGPEVPPTSKPPKGKVKDARQD